MQPIAGNDGCTRRIKSLPTLIYCCYSQLTIPDDTCATLPSLPFIFGLAIPARRRWSSGRFTQQQNEIRRKIPEKPPAMAVFFSFKNGEQQCPAPTIYASAK
jgi:hypothetical protein